MVSVTVDVDHTIGAVRVGNKTAMYLNVWCERGEQPAVDACSGAEEPAMASIRMNPDHMIAMGHACLAVGRAAKELLEQ